MAEVRGILRRKILHEKPIPLKTQLKELKEARKSLEKEVRLRHDLAKQRQEIMKLQEELHPRAGTKLKKFLKTTNELVLHLGKGMQKLGKAVQESEAKKQPKVAVIKAK